MTQPNTVSLDSGTVGNLFLLNLKNLPVNVSDSVTTTRLSFGTDQVSEISFDIEDPGLTFMTAGLFKVDPALPSKLDYQQHKLIVAAIEVNGGATGLGGISIQARSRIMHNLKRRRGAHSLKNISATEYIRRELRSIGVTDFVGQDTSIRKQIARDVPKEAQAPEQGQNYPSAFTTCQRLAQEEGFLFFERVGRIVFAQPSWLLKRDQTFTEVVWQNGADNLRPLAHPVCRVSADNPVLVEITLEMPWNRNAEFYPGDKVRLRGVPGFNGVYLIASVSLDLTRSGNLTVEARSAIDPIVEKTDSNFTVRGVGKYKEVVDWARDAGWSGADLQIAVAIAIAESGGNPRAISPPNTAPGPAQGSRDYGLFQINEYYHVFDKVLILGGQLNAKQAFSIYKAAGNKFTPWSTFKYGQYKDKMDEAASALETTINPGTLVGSGEYTPGKGSTPGTSVIPSRFIESPAGRGWGDHGLSSSQLTLVNIPGIPLRVRTEAAPLFKELIRLLIANGHNHLTSSGGYNNKLIPGSNVWSNHAWGLAVDLDAAHNPYGSRLITDMPKNVREIAHSLGMRWGGDYKRIKDAMHFEIMLSRNDAIAHAKTIGLTRTVTGPTNPVRQSGSGRGGV